ncbi:MAG: hypothetical protein CGW95_13720 [Phenylobacterium zucineum]|nr:MAG: hypothetical protein CGW95_13720 [Phenylobacterium zucineum]
MRAASAPVAIIMGSRSDWPTLKGAADNLTTLGVGWEAKVVSAHRTPDRMYAFAKGAKAAGFKVIIAGAGGAAHLPGMTAALTDLPVLGVPVESKALKGMDSLLSIVQMPAGIPVATLAIGEAGARNAGLLAAQILALGDPALAGRLADYRAALTAGVAESVEEADLAMTPLAPGSTLGILGGGQLGRMLAQAAGRLGFDVVILDPEADCPAARVSAHVISTAYDDREGLAELARRADVVTFEFENVPAGVLDILAELGVETAPCARALAIAQDRIAEKTFLNAAGAPTVAFAEVDTIDHAQEAVKRLGVPCLMKTRRDGYDGKGQSWIEHVTDAEAVFQALGGRPAIVEAPAAFVRELSIIAARSRSGEIAVYPLGENHHEAGVLRRTLAPATVSRSLTDQAEQIAARILTSLEYVGVIGVELFELEGRRLLVNEIAPRVHNTGHWTQDGCRVDQFEQHVRAVMGWPLGPTEAHTQIEMENLLGDEVDTWLKLAAESDVGLHIYGKREAKAGRKMGHVNRRMRN